MNTANTKLLLLASGLGKSRRGYERFVLDMATQLRLNGLEVSCWGSGEGPDIEGLPVIGRDELERLAFERMQRDSRFASLLPSELHDWTLHTEDQLFGIASAVRLRQEIQASQPKIVYLKWQGGLVDAGGKSTVLLEQLARSAKEGSLQTVIHTDWVWAPVIRRLAEAGFAFHSIAPWITRELRELGVPPQSFFELPMGTCAGPLQELRARRTGCRHTFNIPETAFVVLSVGAFDNQVKNYPHLVRDLAPLAQDESFYWVVAGSRGSQPAAWEEQARGMLGSRFVPLCDVPFERMPEVYGAADLFLCASLNETFGLAYIEAQLAGLPCVMHDYHVTQWIMTGWPAELTPISLVNMNTPGAARTAVEKWRMLLANSGGRKAVYQIADSFRSFQEKKFSWEQLGPRFAETFRHGAERFLDTQALAMSSAPTIPPSPAQSTLVSSHPKPESLPEQTKPHPSASFQARQEISQRTPADRPLRILIANDVLPQPDRNGSDGRLLQVLRELLAQGHQLTFLARSGITTGPRPTVLEDLGIKVWAHDSERLRYVGFDVPAQWTLEQVLEEGQFDLAILCQWFWNGTSVPEHYMQAIRRISPSVRIAVLTDDQHGVRERRLATLTGQWMDFERAEDYTMREFEVYRRADIVLAISEDDRRGFLEEAPDLKIDRLPMVAELAPAGPGFAERADLLFVGNFGNSANLDALNWMLEEIWPRLRKQLPTANLSLVGSCLPTELDELSGVRRLGQVADLLPLFSQHRVFVAPIRFGTGIKTKNLLALSHAIPLVTTTVGAEGMNLTPGGHAMIADTPEGIADAVTRCYTDETLWRELAHKGRAHVGQMFSREGLRTAVQNLTEQARTISAKPYDASYESSMSLVEKLHPEVLTARPACYRPTLRAALETGMAEEFLAQDRPAAALSHLRHAFSLVRQPVSELPLFQHVQRLIARCYKELGDPQKAAEYGLPATEEKVTEKATASPQIAPACITETAAIELSVILPTYNRKEKLQACLAHLAYQSLPANRWEIIVVDDGSSDGTEEVLRNFPKCLHLEYIRQDHAGAGAARRAAVERARGQYLLLIKDDTTPYDTFLSNHLKAQAELRGEKVAVLGHRCSTLDATQRALTLFWAGNPLLFAEAALPQKLQGEKCHFFAHSLSVSREAVLAAGSFDPAFQHGEDIELGVRLRAMGYRVEHHEEAKADHNHLDLRARDLAAKACVCGAIQYQLFRKHNHLLENGLGPFGKLDWNARKRIEDKVVTTRNQAQIASKCLEQFDSFDLQRCFGVRRGSRTEADEIMAQVKKWVPTVFWFHFFEGFLQAWAVTTTRTRAKVKAAHAR